MSHGTWKYVENQIDNATKRSRKRMKEIAIHHRDTVAESDLPIGGTLLARIDAALNPFLAAYQGWLGLRAQFKGATLTFQQALDRL
jgi:hypothetical protein